MQRVSFFLFLAALIISDAKAQDPILSQYYSNPIMLNPAYAGGSEGPAVFMNYRNQWPGVDGALVSSVVTVDIPIDKFSGGFGLFSSGNNTGRIIHSGDIGGSYAQAFKISDDFSIRAGLAAKYLRKTVDWSKATLCYDVCNKSYPSYEDYREVETADFSSGLLASGRNFNMGLAVHHLFEPDESLNKKETQPIARRYSAHGSITLSAGKYYFSPQVIIQQQENFGQYLGGTYINRGLFSGGLIYRHTPRNPDVVIASFALKHKYFRIGYSYDITVSRLGMKTYGAHEFSLMGIIRGKKERKKLTPANVPVF